MKQYPNLVRLMWQSPEMFAALEESLRRSNLDTYRTGLTCTVTASFKAKLSGSNRVEVTPACKYAPPKEQFTESTFFLDHTGTYQTSEQKSEQQEFTEVVKPSQIQPIQSQKTIKTEIN